MRITLNDEPREVAAATLAQALDELGFGGARVATAVNGSFVPAPARAGHPLAEGDRLEVLAPMQGG
ncbi:MAG: sulfur carrier protein ThiS [Thermohalobaculum sp.]|nr:sulfur carrier protein ThiS [Thermohalobaculum sp.]